MLINYISSKDDIRNTLLTYANSCDWEAGPILAQKMKENSFSDWEKIFVTTENGKII